MPKTSSSGRPGGNPDLKKHGFKSERDEPLRSRLQLRISDSVKQKLDQNDNWQEFVRQAISEKFKRLLEELVIKILEKELNTTEIKLLEGLIEELEDSEIAERAGCSDESIKETRENLIREINNKNVENIDEKNFVINALDKQYQYPKIVDHIPLESGIYTLECLGKLRKKEEDQFFLNGITAEGLVDLAPRVDSYFSGTKWEIIYDKYDKAEGSYRLKCLGHLRTEDLFLNSVTKTRQVNLVPIDEDELSGIEWEIIPVRNEPDTFRFKCYGSKKDGYKKEPFYLDGRTLDKTVGLLEQADIGRSGTKWKVRPSEKPLELENKNIEKNGEIGRAQLSEPIFNPYIIGIPVERHLFVGRENIMNQLKGLWTGSEQKQCNSVILHGHMRIGKSSILRNLTTILPPNIIVVKCNMRILGIVENTSQLLYNFSLAIYDELSPTQQQQLGEPEEQKSSTAAYRVFDRTIKRLGKILQRQKLIIAIDEFEVIEELIDRNAVELEFIRFLVGLIQNYSYLVLALAGLHTLQEMTADYWNPLYRSVESIKVSFLSREASVNLITNPTSDFDADYDPETVEEIIKLTNGQAYLIQLICSNLVDFVNNQIHEGRERRFTCADLDAVLKTENFWINGNAYFTGVWEQAKSHPEGQIAILNELSRANLSSSEIVEKTGLTPTQVKEALETLMKHDVIAERQNQYSYEVELMRRWVLNKNIAELS